MTQEPKLASLAAFMRERSVQTGSFTLASGRKSSYYIDARRTTMSARGLDLIGGLGLTAIHDKGWQPRLVGGLTLGADPVAYAIALASRRTPSSIDAFSVRKEAKTHGAKRQIEGCFASGESVVIVEDVVTTGSSASRAAEVVLDAGGVVLGVLAVVDREEGGREHLRSGGLDLVTLLSLRDLGLTPSQ